MTGCNYLLPDSVICSGVNLIIVLFCQPWPQLHLYQVYKLDLNFQRQCLKCPHPQYIEIAATCKCNKTTIAHMASCYDTTLKCDHRDSKIFFHTNTTALGHLKLPGFSFENRCSKTFFQFVIVF